MSADVLELEPLPIGLGLADQAMRSGDSVTIADEAAAYLAAQVAASDRQRLATIAELSPEIARAAQKTVVAMASGRLAVHESVVDGSGRRYNTAYDMLMAPEDDEVAKMGGVTNVVTMLQESVAPHTNIIEVNAYVDENATVWQYGTNDQSIALNTLQLDRSATAQVESANLLAVGPLVRDGYLRHGGPALWEFSIIPEGERAALRDQGYFMHTMSFIARRISVGPDGRTLTIRSHFMAGADFLGIAERLGPVRTEQDAIAREEAAQRERHDKRVLGRFFTEVLQVPDDVAQTSDGFLRHAGFIDESAFEGGEAGVIASIDHITAQEIGSDTVFYGVRGASGDHAEFVAEQQRHEQGVVDAAKQIWAQARQLARRPGVRPKDIPGILKELSKTYIADEALQGRADVMVLGSRAAVTAMAAIEAFRNGDVARAEALRSQTIEHTQPGGCPPAEGDEGDCAFMSKECPECGKKNVWTTVAKLANGKTRISGSCKCSVTSH